MAVDSPLKPKEGECSTNHSASLAAFLGPAHIGARSLTHAEPSSLKGKRWQAAEVGPSSEVSRMLFRIHIALSLYSVLVSCILELSFFERSIILQQQEELLELFQVGRALQSSYLQLYKPSIMAHASRSPQIVSLACTSRRSLQSVIPPAQVMRVIFIGEGTLASFCKCCMSWRDLSAPVLILHTDMPR